MLKSLLVCLIAGSALATDWPQWRGPNRDLICTEKGLLGTWPEGGPQQLWKVDLAGSGYSTPSIVAGKVYITGSSGGKKDRKGTLFCLDAKTGKTLWTADYGPEWGENFEMARTSPTVSEGLVYVFSGMGRLSCFSAADGQKKWTVDTVEEFAGRNIQWGYAESPFIYDGKVITQPGGALATVAALDAKSGKKIWTVKVDDQRSSYCTPSLGRVDGKRQLLTMLDNSAVGLDAETGKLLWKFQYRNKWGVHPNAPLIVGPNQVFLTSGYNYGSHLLEIKNGEVKVLWHNDKDNHFQGSTFVNGLIYSPSTRAMVIQNPTDGSIAGTAEGVGKASFVVIPGGMITYSEKTGTVSLVEVGKEGVCTVKSSFKIDYGSQQHWSSPVVSDGVLFLRHGEGFAAFRVK